MSVALRDRPRPLDFRYRPRATGTRGVAIYREGPEGDLVASSCLLASNDVSYLVASLLANASLSESIDDVVVLSTKLQIARTCIAYLMEPLDSEVRPDFIQFG
jgi:hypothetical protein